LNKLLISSVLILLPLICSSKEIHDTKGVAVSESKKQACHLALNYARKEALDEAGVMVQAESSLNQKSFNDQANSTFEFSVNEKTAGIVKTISVNELTKYDPDSGAITCTVNASFQIEGKNPSETNRKKIQGELPDWVRNPPNILGKVSVVSRSRSKEGAIASALLEFKSEIDFEHRLDPDELQQGVVQTSLTQSSSIKGSNISKINDNGFVELTASVRLFLDSAPVLIYMKRRDEINPQFFKEKLKVIEEIGLSILFDELAEEGIEVKTELVTTEDEHMWYALIVAKKHYIDPKNVFRMDAEE